MMPLRLCTGDDAHLCYPGPHAPVPDFLHEHRMQPLPLLDLQCMHVS